MNEQTDFSREDAMLADAATKGPVGKALIYTRLSGPGWLQGAITLGGGSLAGALYLGVIAGYDLMWLQPIAMVLGVIMLSAISYVALSTGERPFQTLKTHISPVLAWGWLIATMMANIVWCLPQFALGTASVQQNLLPSTNSDTGKIIVAITILIVASVVVWFYNSGSKGIKAFELILKGMVGIVVLSFFGVVLAMTFEGALDWGKIMAGFVPNLTYLFEPVPSLAASVSETGEYRDWWTNMIAGIQKDRIITAFATAVGINMTFLLPYSMLRKGWGVKHRTLAIFDLSIGLIVPFVLATSCVVIAAASQFHGNSADVTQMLQDGKTDSSEVKEYFKFLDKRILEESPGASEPELLAARESLPESDKQIAAMLVGRDNFALAGTLEPLVGRTVAQTLFGVGVLGMAVSTIIILMLINGFAFCELMNVPPEGTMHRIGCFIPAVGVLGPFFWGQAAPALAVPTSVIGGAMLPIAYLSFLLLMNSRRALGDAMPTGIRRVVWNTLMIFATAVAGFGSAWGLLSKGTIGYVALASIVVMLLLGVGGFIKKQSQN
ncbi:divalent metal cation transporter [Rubripirellula reticaptiva]|uniref:Natural resistance-associated macrophage protein n=1 Tax=Rubripirellula reticaptiva TaxID=2528013 RepID=A0A5C6F6H5_9BACT|nr:divalent metal cation transporter [Rubripirellula reticaptiva]TWU55429.1 Natural resistance-associated macrophage protein [Rubripirellula reticaptiva]